MSHECVANGNSSLNPTGNRAMGTCDIVGSFAQGTEYASVHRNVVSMLDPLSKVNQKLACLLLVQDNQPEFV